MGKLTFIYGVMGSAKSANALMQYFELRHNQKKVLLLKSKTNTRDGGLIKSRIGLQENALLIDDNTNFYNIVTQNNYPTDLIIDEVQFLNKNQIDELKDICTDYNIKIFCYGLKTDFTSHLFESSKRLMEIADEIKKLEMSCSFCDNSAEINARIDNNGKVITNGDLILIASNDKYKPMCYRCWKFFQNHITS